MEVVAKAHTYEVKLKWDHETDSGIARSGDRMPLIFGLPPEFGGSENTWSPEHLLAASVASCYSTTFLHFARLLKIDVTDFRISAKVDFEKGTAGFVATRIVLRPVVELHHNPGQYVLDNLFAKARKYCFVSNSLKSELVVEPHVRQE